MDNQTPLKCEYINGFGHAIFDGSFRVTPYQVSEYDAWRQWFIIQKEAIIAAGEFDAVIVNLGRDEKLVG